MRWDFSAGDEVEVGGDVARPLGVGTVARGRWAGGGRRARRWSGTTAASLADGGSVGVVEVVAGGEDLDGHAAGASAGTGCGEGVEQAGVQAMLEEDVGGESGLHWC